MAADMFVPDPTTTAPLPGYVWNGGYVGVQGGYGWGTSDIELAGLPAAGSFAKTSGWLAGLYAGYNYQFDNAMVLGLEGDLAWSNIGGWGDATGIGVGPGNGVSYQLDWQGAVRARVGLGADRFMPYLAGGVAFAGAQATPHNAFIPRDTHRGNLVGWTVGVGVEFALSDAFVARAEYRYSDFGAFDFTDVGVDGKYSFKASDVRLGLSYKF